MGTARPSIVRDTMMTPLLPFLILGLAGVRAETTGACSEHIRNSHSLHKIILDDFSDSMTYLLMSSSFSTDVKNRMGFGKYFKDYSDKMWSRGKDMMKYVLKRGGHMGSAFQVPLYSGNGLSVASLDYSNELKSLGVTLDLLKTRTSQLSDAHKHSTSYSSLPTSYDPDTAHMLEEVSESYTEDINEAARKLNTLARIVQQSPSLGLHMFDKSLM